MTTPADLVDELRRLIDVIRITDLEVAAGHGVDLGEVTARIGAIRSELEPHVVDDLRMQRGLYAHEHFTNPPAVPNLADVAPRDFFPYSPVIGALNPIAPDVHLRVEGDQVVGSGTVSAAHNGPPGGVHGGHVAALMDELLGVTCIATGTGGFTGTLTVRYENLTPLDTELTLRGWIDRIEGRKIFAKGEIHAGDIRCAVGEGIFIRRAEAP
ncbi:MAG: hotdog domain-containing protein [Acidimicrobiales bacterium]